MREMRELPITYNLFLILHPSSFYYYSPPTSISKLVKSFEEVVSNGSLS